LFPDQPVNQQLLASDLKSKTTSLKRIDNFADCVKINAYTPSIQNTIRYRLATSILQIRAGIQIVHAVHVIRAQILFG